MKPWETSGRTTMLRPPGDLVTPWSKPGLGFTSSGLATRTLFRSPWSRWKRRHASSSWELTNPSRTSLSRVKEVHTESGYPWTQQLHNAARICTRSVLRGVGGPTRSEVFDLDSRVTPPRQWRGIWWWLTFVTRCCGGSRSSLLAPGIGTVSHRHGRCVFHWHHHHALSACLKGWLASKGMQENVVLQMRREILLSCAHFASICWWAAQRRQAYSAMDYQPNRRQMLKECSGDQDTSSSAFLWRDSQKCRRQLDHLWTHLQNNRCSHTVSMGPGSHHHSTFG